MTAPGKHVRKLPCGGEFHRWRQWVGEFLAEAKETRRHGLSIGVNVVVSKQNLGEIRDIVRLAADLGFDIVYLLDPIPVDDVAASLCPSPADLSDRGAGRIIGLGQAPGIEDLRAPFAPAACGEGASVLHATVGIRLRPRHWRVAPCSRLFGSDKGAVMGNILRQEFWEIWHGDRFRQYRRSSASGTNALCRVCPYH